MPAEILLMIRAACPELGPRKAFMVADILCHNGIRSEDHMVEMDPEHILEGLVYPCKLLLALVVLRIDLPWGPCF